MECVIKYLYLSRLRIPNAWANPCSASVSTLAAPPAHLDFPPPAPAPAINTLHCGHHCALIHQHRDLMGRSMTAV